MGGHGQGSDVSVEGKVVGTELCLRRRGFEFGHYCSRLLVIHTVRRGL